ncbi:phage tail tape measure protein [Chelatococcus asaccharovorans]|uniref:phage tail tape measure protein n=1 Tax=Chelatococcus asaccharovorans TaxID=28210 RepID=UPI00224C6839|nr:phage tail tape measure protein [Chelatococcus asaccharovorans]CAH1649813.1 hypothetical protein CHELA40_10277 [Chelatococcus asaccharovorans]CAH1686890.1 hypothetical protein CHELA17_65333 [Chelatococcus asaccharovorans]
MATRTSSLVLRLVDQLSGPSKGAAASLKGIAASAKDLEKIGKVDAFRGAMRSMKEASAAFKAAQQHVRRLKAEMAATASPTRQMESSLKAAERAAVSAKTAFLAQGQAARSAMSTLSQSGLSVRRLASDEERLRASIEKTNAALHRRAARVDAIRGLGGMAAAGSLYGAYRVREFGRKSIISAADFDIGVRKQKEFTEISAKDQEEILVPQAKKIGQETQFSNLDVVKAQTVAMTGLPSDFSKRLKVEVGAGILENVKNYAMIMESDLETSAQAIRTYLQATNKDISSKEKALAEANKAVNQVVRMAKLGGMNDEDVQEFLKYGAPTATAAGVSPEAMMSIGALARRGGLRGDEAGVFMRATASKLVAPTKKGLAALNAAGINYSDYVRMPDQLDPDRLEGQFRQNMGVGLRDDTKERLQKVLSNKDILGDRGRFIEEVTGAVEQQFPKTKKGTMRPADRMNIAKVADTFYKLSAQSVDAEGLLNAVMNSNMTLAQLNAFLTDKHGGKGAITQRQRDEYVSAQKELANAGNDPDYAKRKADEIMGGLGGSLENLRGSFDNLLLSVGVGRIGTTLLAGGMLVNDVYNLPDNADDLQKLFKQNGENSARIEKKLDDMLPSWLNPDEAVLEKWWNRWKKDDKAVSSPPAGTAGKPDAAPDLRSSVSEHFAIPQAKAGNDRDFTLGSRSGFEKIGKSQPRNNRGHLSEWDTKRVAPSPAGRADPIHLYGGNVNPNAFPSMHTGFAKPDESANEAARIRPRSEAPAPRAEMQSEAAAEAVRAGTPAEVTVTVQPKVDETSMDAAKAKAEQTGAEMQSSLSIKATPQVDTSSLDAATAKARALAAELSRVNGLATQVGRMSQGNFSQTMRGVSADPGIEGR